MGLGLVGGLKVQMFKLALMLIEVQKVNLALMPPFCQTPVSCISFFCLSISFIVVVSLCFGRVALLNFLSLVSVLEKNSNVPPNALAYVSLNNIPSVNIFVMSVGLMLVKSDLNLTSETLSGILILSTFEMS